MPSGANITGEAPIFEIIPDSRSRRSRLWSFAAGVLLNALLLILVAISSQLMAARHAAERMFLALRGELVDPRLIAMIQLPPRPPDPVAKAAKAAAEPPEPDSRILDGFYPQVAEFVRDNKMLEAILTREIVRDVRTRVLSPEILNPGNSMRLSFDVDENGQVRNRRILRSSRVPSIDRLFLELIALLETYQIFVPMKGLESVVATLAVQEGIEVRLEGETVSDTAAEECRRQLQNTLTLTRFALAGTDATEMLEDVQLDLEGRRISMTKVFDKQPIIDFLLHYNIRGSGAPGSSRAKVPRRR